MNDQWNNMATKTINKQKNRKKSWNIFSFLLNHKSVSELSDLSPKSLKEILSESWDAGLENICTLFFEPTKYLRDWEWITISCDANKISWLQQIRRELWIVFQNCAFWWMSTVHDVKLKEFLEVFNTSKP